MKTSKPIHTVRVMLTIGSVFLFPFNSQAAAEGWSVVPYIGSSQLSDQTPSVSGTDDIADGSLDISVDAGFTAGLGFRYDYKDSRWASELGWEYRSNDAQTTTPDRNRLPDGNYASNTFYINGRYALTDNKHITPWIGGGLTWIQELDLDSEDSDGERSFADSGSIGFQIMAGADYSLSERFYLTGEIRYSDQSNLDLDEETGNGVVSDIDYQPITLGLGLGIRF